MPVQLSQPVNRALRVFRVDFAPAHRQPSAGSVLTATIASVAGSLAADALLVVIGQAAFPSTRGYAHFQFSDYSKLTIIGVVIACIAWPVVTRISSAPRWLFSRMAVAVTLVLWLPDIYILLQGQPSKAVAVLFVMHLAIAVVTYYCLVYIARTGPSTTDPAPADDTDQLFAPPLSTTPAGRATPPGQADATRRERTAELPAAAYRTRPGQGRAQGTRPCPAVIPGRREWSR